MRIYPTKEAKDWVTECYLMAIRFDAGEVEERKCRHINAVYLRSILPTLHIDSQLVAVATIENLLS